MNNKNLTISKETLERIERSTKSISEALKGLNDCLDLYKKALNLACDGWRLREGDCQSDNTSWEEYFIEKAKEQRAEFYKTCFDKAVERFSELSSKSDEIFPDVDFIEVYKNVIKEEKAKE